MADSTMNSRPSDSFQIPVIELSADTQRVGQELVDAAERYGFIFIRNRHEEIPSKEVEHAFDMVGLSLWGSVNSRC